MAAETCLRKQVRGIVLFYFSINVEKAFSGTLKSSIYFILKQVSLSGRSATFE